MGAPVPEIVHCPHCQAENPAIEERCQSCGEPLAIYIGPPPPLPRRFSLGTAMILIALIAVCLGVMRAVPGLGILMLLVLTPSLLRTFLAAARRKADERPMNPLEKLGVFMTSLCVVLLIGVAAGIAFFTTCFVGFWGGAGVRSLWPQNQGYDAMGWGFFVGVPLGIIAALYVVYLLGRHLWAKGLGD